MPTSAEIQKINRAQNYPIERVVSLLGISLDKKGYFVCPFHQDPVPSMGIVKAKNKCKCFSCNAEATPLDLIQVILGYSDILQAVDFLLRYNTPIQLKPEVPVDPSEPGTVPESTAGLPVIQQILTRFYQDCCGEVPKFMRDSLSSFRLSGEYFQRRDMVVLEKSETEVITDFSHSWSVEDLVGSGLFKIGADNGLSLIFDQNMILFPHYDTRVTGLSYPAVTFISGIRSGGRLSEEVHTHPGSWMPYMMNRIDPSKKILFCEGVVNVLTVATHSTIYSPVSLVYDYLKPEMVSLFANADISIAMHHTQALPGQKQKQLTEAYHERNRKISELFKEVIRQNVNILATPIGVELGQYFKRFRKN